MYKHLKDYKKDQPRSGKVPPYISLPIGESMKNNELEIEKYIYDKPLSQKYSSEDIGTLFADIPLLFDNEKMIVPTTDIEDFIVELPNLKPAQEIKKIQLPRKTSEIRMRNIEQMILENPKNMNLIEKCILVYEHRTFKDYITLKYGDEYQLNFTSDPTLDEGGLYFNMVSKKELAKKEEIKKKAEKKKQESKKRRNQGIESSEGYSTFMRSDVEDCECHKTFKKDFPFSMKELRAMVHNMKYLKTIVQESKELTNMLMIHAEQSTSNTH